MAGKSVDGKLYEHFDPKERLTLLLEAYARDDAAEADRLRESCPRKTYTSGDEAFEARVRIAFDVMAIVCIDLRYLLGKLVILQVAAQTVQEFSSMNLVTADLAFIEGLRCAQGKPQMGYFSKDWVPFADDDLADDDDDGVDEEVEPQDEYAGVEEEVQEVDDETPTDEERSDQGERMQAVERRAERSADCMLVVFHGAAKAVAADFMNTWASLGMFCRSRIGIEPETMLKAWGLPILADIEATLKIYKDVKPDPAKVAEYEALICKGWDRRFS